VCTRIVVLLAFCSGRRIPRGPRVEGDTATSSKPSGIRTGDERLLRSDRPARPGLRERAGRGRGGRRNQRCPGPFVPSQSGPRATAQNGERGGRLLRAWGHGWRCARAVRGGSNGLRGAVPTVRHYERCTPAAAGRDLLGSAEAPARAQTFGVNLEPQRSVIGMRVIFAAERGTRAPRKSSW
jgi:hypothetical protein